MFKNLLLSLFLILASTAAQADTSTDGPWDHRTYQNPLFVGIERVYIFFDYDASSRNEHEIPETFKKDNIEQEVFDAYSKRFSSKHCKEFFKKAPTDSYPYECNDQPVILIPQKYKSEFYRGDDTPIASAKEFRDKNTLNVVFRVAIQRNTRGYSPPLEVPHAVISHLQYRPDFDVHNLARKLGVVVSSVPINQETESLKGSLFMAIYGRLK